jgi:anti-repressor protein
MLMALADEVRQKEEAQAQVKAQQSTIAVLAPKAEFHDAVARASAQDAVSVRQFAKLIGTGQNRLFDFMRKAGILIPGTTEPYQSFKEQGYFRVVEENFEDGKGRDRVYLKTLITPKGQAWLHRKWAVGGAA